MGASVVVAMQTVKFPVAVLHRWTVIMFKSCWLCSDPVSWFERTLKWCEETPVGLHHHACWVVELNVLKGSLKNIKGICWIKAQCEFLHQHRNWELMLGEEDWAPNGARGSRSTITKKIGAKRKRSQPGLVQMDLQLAYWGWLIFGFWWPLWLWRFMR